MAIPVPIPSGPLPVVDTETLRAEAFVAAVAQIVKNGTSGGTASIGTPATLIPDSSTNPVIDPTTGLPKISSLVLDTPQAQLFYRQLALALAKSLVPFASSTVAGITHLSTDPTVASIPIAVNSEEVTTTPTPNKIPRAGPSGLIDSGWVGGPGGSPLTAGTFTGVCLPSAVVGDLVYMNTVGNVVRLADPTDNTKMPIAGCIISKPSSNSCLVQTGDLVFSVYTGLTVGKLHFVGTNGRPTATRPSPTVGNYVLVQPCGIAIDTNLLLMTPGTNITRLWG